jgi:hypothetical protein
LGAARANLDIDYAATPQTGGGFSPLGAANIVAAGTGTIKSTGVVAGGQLGYGWQWGHLVAGGELDLSYTDLSGTRVAPVFNVPNNLHQSFAVICSPRCAAASAMRAGPGSFTRPAGLRSPT